MSEVVNMSNVLDNNEELQPLLELVQSIMELPDEGLEGAMAESLTGMINGALSPAIKRESIAAMLRGFEEQGYTRDRAQFAVDTTKQEFANYIDALGPTRVKRELLNTVFDALYEVFDTAVEQYHSYNITLPIMLDEGAQVPTYAHETDAAADLYAAEDITLSAHSLSNMVKTGVHIALSEGWAALVLPRSSMGLKTGLRLSNSIGLIDEEYHGEIGVIYDNISDSDYTINKGDRIAQLLVVPSYRFKSTLVTELPESDRGENGFGSTGK